MHENIDLSGFSPELNNIQNTVIARRINNTRLAPPALSLACWLKQNLVI